MKLVLLYGGVDSEAGVAVWGGCCMGSCLIVLCSDLERFNVVFISDCGCESVIDVFLFVSFLFSVHHVSLSFSTSHIYCCGL